MSLLYAIETCLRATRVPPSRFGREAVKDPRLVHDLRRGRQPGAAIERRIRDHIAEALEIHARAPGSAAPDRVKAAGGARRASAGGRCSTLMQGEL